ncbi:Ig-like domain-containing protein [Microbacterium sp.]|uniref:Ig-like domain-containing protein n=1 Tax=Microbacterium sp. TaxID=51671 RepID=UPI0025E95214|nr:Ig-like domain-containing protein [Microbacterium sp.]
MKRGRRTLIAGLAGLAAVGVIAGVSVVWPGLDARETPSTDASVWALQTGDGRRYARVNTAIGELDTVRGIGNPSMVAQSASGAYLFSESFGKVTRIDEALPVDIDDDALRESPSTPEGTVDVAVAGDFAAYLTDSGAVWAGRLSDASPAQVDPFSGADDDAPSYAADAIAVDERGMLYSYSARDAAVLRYDIPTGQARGSDEARFEVDDPGITAAGDVWFVVDLDDGRAWRRGDDVAIETETVGGRVLGVASATADAALIADETSLVRLPADGSAPVREEGTGEQILGAPAAPVTVDGVAYAAWLPQGAGDGVLWNSQTQSSALEYGGGTLGDERRPVFVVGSGAVVLNETRSGWVWNLPSGRLLPSSQDWTLGDQIDAQAQESEEQAAVVLDPKPPIAQPDAFGVRGGALASLPVLLNDHDPNEDVLSIDPESVTGLDPGFGVVTITDNGQRLAVRVDAAAQGSASFSYRVTDGTAAPGLVSEPTTVTLSVVGDAENAAPQWCGTTGCLADRPSAEVAPGGTVVVPVLQGWVDPDGDPLLLASVQNPSGIGTVAASPAGEVVYQHSDDGSGAAQQVELSVSVADTRGGITSMDVSVRIGQQPALQAQSFALIDTLSEGGFTVDVAPHVTGTAGLVSLTSVRVLDDAPATAVAAPGGTAFDITARESGVYRVSYTVGDGSSEVTATARITLLDEDAQAQLTTAPVVAFVHPREDATVDVFRTVSNPTRRVLLLSDVRATARDGSNLSVDVVAQDSLRVSGTTASGAPGVLGTVTYTVSDGTDDTGSRVEGEATIYLLPPAPELAPIAVEDRVVVRQGAQIDIPVLENDVAPAGSALTLNPESVRSSAPGALAFAAGDSLRYLAPDEPGEYTIDYGVFASGSPSLADTASVRVRVTSDDANRAPLPETLEGRVLSGQSTTVDFDGFGVDPDGDAVVLDAVLTQPESGSATLAADGASIVYSSVSGFQGQVSFRYRVVDSLGVTGTATARIGVLDEQTNPSPVTFTDYVQVQAGAASEIRISPLANDVDPTRGALTLTDVRPDLVATLEDGTSSPEFMRQDALIRAVDDQSVTIAAGTQPATMSFLYDVESDSGNTGRGLIVVKVVREAVPNYPVVADTVLTVETREQFTRGVDVVAGKVSWSGGDASDLTLSLWGEPAGVEVSGDRVSGPLPMQSRLVAFRLQGEGPAGPVETYGFLRIPGEQDLTLALRSSVRALDVTEGRSRTFDMDALVASPRGSDIELGPDVSASGARAEGSCTVEDGTRIRYDAGFGGPWVDACHVPVRIVGIEEWTYLSVPVHILAVEPQPELRSGSLTVGPGESATYDLRTLTTWQGTEDWDRLVYVTQYTGSAFDVTALDGVVQITGADRAVPGTEEAVQVTVTSHTGVAPARLILRVGAAPVTLPRGGTLVQTCSQAAGSSCTIPVLGGAGEVNPLPRTPLELVAVRSTGECAGVSFSVAGPASVAASWAADAPGATCTAAFSVRDAQGRVTTADRDGSLLLDLQGFPRTPASVTQVAYDDGLVTLRVDPGEARQAYPALTGFVVRHAGAVVATCAADGTCPVISAPNGEERSYEAAAVNAVGESAGVVRVVAWAYDPPSAPASLTASPVVTGGEGGVVSLRIDGVDAAGTGYLEIVSAAGESARVDVGRGETEVTLARFRVGANTATPVTVTPYSRFAVPPGLPGSTSGGSVTALANGVGAPRDAELTLEAVSAGDGTTTVRARASASSGGDGSSLLFGIVRAGSDCEPTQSDPTEAFVGLPDGDEYGFTACVASVIDDRTFGTASAAASVRAVQSGDAPRGFTYVVSSTPVVTDRQATWIIRDRPTSSEPVPNNNVVEYRGGPPTGVFDRNPGLEIRYTHRLWDTSTGWATATPRAGSAPYQIWARWSVTSCIGGSPLAVSGDSSGDAAAISFALGGAVFRDAGGAALPFDASTGVVPIGAVSVSNIGVTADWSAQGWGLDAASASFGGGCDPNNPAPPPPEPEPEPEPEHETPALPEESTP